MQPVWHCWGLDQLFVGWIGQSVHQIFKQRRSLQSLCQHERQIFWLEVRFSQILQLNDVFEQNSRHSSASAYKHMIVCYKLCSYYEGVKTIKNLQYHQINHSSIDPPQSRRTTEAHKDKRKAQKSRIWDVQLRPGLYRVAGAIARKVWGVVWQCKRRYNKKNKWVSHGGGNGQIADGTIYGEPFNSSRAEQNIRTKGYNQ